MHTVMQTARHRRVSAQLGGECVTLQGTTVRPVIADIALLVLPGPAAPTLPVPTPRRRPYPRSRGRHPYRAGIR